MADVTVYDDQNPDYTPTRWCIGCGWSTDDPDETECECPR